MRSRLLVSLGILVIAAAFAVVAVSRAHHAFQSDVPAPTDAPTLASLSGEPEARLQAPGSTEFLAGGTEAVWTLESGSTPAIAWRRYGVHASWEDIVSYFSAEMKARGWEVGGCSSGIQSTGEWAVEAWHSDDRILRLGHRRDLPKDAGSIGTYYSVAIIGHGPAPVCIRSYDRASSAISPSP